jgi:hypothetical protein
MLAGIMANPNREQILQDLIELRIRPEAARKALAAFDWDSPELVTVSARDVERVIQKWLDGVWTAADCEAWADAIEVRDDVGFSNERVKQACFELANPLLTEPLTQSRAHTVLHELAAPS